MKLNGGTAGWVQLALVLMSLMGLTTWLQHSLTVVEKRCDTLELTDKYRDNDINAIRINIAEIKTDLKHIINELEKQR